MDTQSIVNIGITIAGCFGGWVLNRIMASLDKLDQDVKDLPNKYTRRDDYIRDVAEIKSLLQSIFDKIDGKVDK
jgi:hypothetical protein